MFVNELSGYGFETGCSHLTSDIESVSSKKFLDIRATIECGFTLKRVRHMIISFSQYCNYQHWEIYFPKGAL